MADATKTFRFRRRDLRAVSAVVGTLLMVAITIVLAAVLYVTVGGMLGSAPMPQPKFILSAGPWSNGSVVVTILSVENAGGVTPVNLRYLVQATNGTSYFYGGEGTLTLTANITVTVSYGNSGPEFVGPDDHMTLSVTPANASAVRTASFKVLIGNSVAGQIDHLS